MVQVSRQLQLKKIKKILVHIQNGVTASEKKQTEVVTNHFKKSVPEKRRSKKYRTNRDENTIHRCGDKNISEQVKK